MARIRSLKIGFFQNDNLCSLPAMDRLLFAGLWLIADRDGRLEDRPTRIRAELFPYEPVFDCESALNRLADLGFIHRYDAGTLKAIQITKFAAHQNPHQREVSSGIPAFSGAKTQSPEKVVPSPEKVVPSPSLALDEPGGFRVMGLGLGNGLGNGSQSMRPTHKPRQSIFGGVHPNCDPATFAACNRSMCIPPFVVKSWRGQMGSTPETHAYIQTFVDEVMAKCPEGVPIGDEPLKFWRAQWQAKHGTAVQSAPTSKAGRTAAAADRVLAKYRAQGLA